MFIDGNVWELTISCLLLGAGTFILYPICVSHVNDKIDDDERVEASGLLILLQSVGMIVGPIVISYLMQTFGSICFLLSFSVANGAFVLFVFKQISFKPYINYKNVTKTDPIPLTPTHVYPEIAQEDGLISKAKELFKNKH